MTIFFYMVSNLPSIRHPTIRGTVSIAYSSNIVVK